MALGRENARMDTAPAPTETPPPVDPLLVDQAVEWAREAGELTLGWFRSAELHINSKADGSPVTMADREAEHLLRRRISEAHPDDSILGEEHDDLVGSSGRTWVIDPIDGTVAFSHGVGTYSNLLFLEDEHGPAVGVINLPVLGETVWAGRGRGCFLDGEPTGVGPAPAPPESSTPASLDGSVLCVSAFHDWSPAMFGHAQEAGVRLRTWGDAYGYTLVATGRVAAMFDPFLAWWDLATVMIVIEEAGGRITQHDGSPEVSEPTMPPPYPYSAIASDGWSHDLWVDLLARP